MTAAHPLTPAGLTALDASPHLADRTAARIARTLHGQPPWTEVGSDVNLAVKFGDVSRSTVSNAKRKLAQLGVIVKSGSYYYTAPVPFA